MKKQQDRQTLNQLVVELHEFYSPHEILMAHAELHREYVMRYGTGNYPPEVFNAELHHEYERMKRAALDALHDPDYEG